MIKPLAFRMRPTSLNEVIGQDELVKLGFNVKTGVFGADMKVSFINDGPYTLVIDSDELGY